ncbi:MAG: branched-chain amino acid aminotransferase [Psychrobacillus sp.]
MIKKKLTQKITESAGGSLSLTKEEHDYALTNELLSDTASISVIESDKLFENAIIERFDKETEELISKESSAFLKTPITHFKDKMNEFMYLETPHFETLSVDAIAFEYDEVFEVYTAMFGLSVQKKHGDALKGYLNEHFDGKAMNYSVMFSAGDGLWEVNLPLNYIDGFNTNYTIEETYQFLYRFLFSLVASTEN